MKRVLTIVAAGISLALLAFSFVAAHDMRATRAALAAKDSVLAATVARLEHEKAAVDTVWRVDSLTFVKWRTRYDSTADTIRVRDTLYVRKDVADGTVKACSELLESCAVRVAKRDSIIAAERQRREALERTVKLEQRERRKGNITWGLVGAAAGRLSCVVR